MSYNYESAIQLVISAKKFIDEYKDHSYTKKGDNDFVTEADMSISNYLKEELQKQYPTIGFFSEEEEGSLKDNCWILDPIDGTTNFIRGYNMSSISLAHYNQGCVVFGIVYNPFSGEVFTSQKGQGAYVAHISDHEKKRKMSVSQRSVKESIVEFGAGSTKKQHAEENFEIGYHIFKEIGDLRRICSTALALCNVADGRIEGYFEKIIKPWDIAAGGLFVQEAGGVITDYNNDPINYNNKETTVIVSNGCIHDFLCHTIQEHTNKKKQG